MTWISGNHKLIYSSHRHPRAGSKQVSSFNNLEIYFSQWRYVSPEVCHTTQFKIASPPPPLSAVKMNDLTTVFSKVCLKHHIWALLYKASEWSNTITWETCHLVTYLGRSPDPPALAAEGKCQKITFESFACSDSLKLSTWKFVTLLTQSEALLGFVSSVW